jgi:predicted Zn-dependent peptidase
MDEDFIEREKSVVLDEIAQADDSPEDRVHELLYECYFNGHPLSKPVLGAKRVISSLTREKLVDFRRAHYAWDNTVFSIAGSFDEKTVFEALEQVVPDSAHEQSTPLPQAHQRSGRTVRYEVKSVEQLHIALAFPGVERDHRLMIAINVLNNIVGGGMSSRLFQTLREELGLVYGIFTYPVYHSCGGMVVVDTGTIDPNGPQVLEKIREQIRRIVADGVTEEEFLRAREQLRGNFILSREGIESRMSGGGRSVLFYGRRRTEQETLERIDRVTRDDVMEAARMVFDFDRMAAAFVGRRGSKKVIEGMLEAW